MCGIVGIMRFDGRQTPPDVLARMTQALAHRGPEGRGVRLLTTPAVQVGLGHTRLKVVDLSDSANQPMANESGSVWVVFNGEIYNFQALRHRLEGRGFRWRTTSDTEVLLRLYEAEGERCVEALEGMFAFAIWDAPRQHLFLARDRVGKKPLFYCQTPAFFAFASEIKALLRHPEITPQVQAEALPAFFLYGYVPTPQTLYQGIQALPPGQHLTISLQGRVQQRAYWPLTLPTAPARRPPSRVEAAGRVRELLTAAVRKRLIADVPLGAFLSGGLDSSIIVGLMSQLMAEPVQTFSIGFPHQPHFDETTHARTIAQRFGTRHTEFMVEPSAVELIEHLVWHHDGPFADASAIPTYLLARLTRQHVTVALTGDGGDELFAGYLRFYATLLAERVPAPLRHAAHQALAGLPAWGSPRGLWRRAQKFAGSAALPFAERFSRWNAVFYEDLPRLLPQQRAVAASPPELLSRLAPYLKDAEGASALTRLLYLNMKTYLLDDLLVKTDRCTMAHALEARSPFLDHALIEYVFTLPDAMKLSFGQTKVILRQAFADLLPPAILRRGKMGFGVPLRAWFAADLRDYLQDLLLAPEAKLRAYVDQDYVRALYEAHLAGGTDHSARLWTLLTFEVWLRQLPQWREGATEPALSVGGLHVA